MLLKDVFPVDPLYSIKDCLGNKPPRSLDFSRAVCKLFMLVSNFNEHISMETSVLFSESIHKGEAVAQKSASRVQIQREFDAVVQYLFSRLNCALQILHSAEPNH